MSAVGHIVVVTSGGVAAYVIINAISRAGYRVTVIEEKPESKWVFLTRRARKFGWITALGQLGTMILSRLGKLKARHRIRAIAEEYGANISRDPALAIIKIGSINDSDGWKTVYGAEPDVVFCVSCRILSQQTLARFSVPVLNFHSGILPQYRGMLGGYWARVRGDDDNFGATVHLVDSGVDTGASLYQAFARPDKRDTISTYPILLAAASHDIVLKSLADAVSGTLKPKELTGQFAQYYHPAIWTYLKNGLSLKIW